MGDTKFVPNLDLDKFELIVKTSKAYKTDTETTENLWKKCKGPIYKLTDRTKSLGLAEQGVTTYFSDNCTKEDSDLVNEWLKLKKVEAYLCRTFKTVVDGHTTYEIKLASKEKGPKEGITLDKEDYKGRSFKITRGDYSALLALVIDNLVIAKKHAANENQIKMIDEYVSSFAEGSLEAHKQGSR